MSLQENAALDAAAEAYDLGQGDRVLRAVSDFLRRYILYPSTHAQVAHTLWCAHAHCMDQLHTTPRLAFMSPEKESGKTRALEGTERLVPGALLSFNLSPAALVRKVAGGGCTVLFDEIDALFGSTVREEQNLDVRSILNSGYKRGAKAYRCTTHGKKVEVEELDSFAPVALAGLKNLPDTLASRAIIIRMRRRAPDEAVEQFRLRKVQRIAAPIYQQLETWCRSLEIEDAEPEMPKGVVDRAAECWEPLLVLADAAGGDWPRLARAAAEHFVMGGRDETTSPGVELLEHIREAFGDSEQLWTETLLERLLERPESPWKDIHGKPLNDRGLAKRLKGYGIKSRDVRLGDTNRKGYLADQFHDDWRRYLPAPAPVSATSATSATKLNNQNKNVALVALVALTPTRGATCAHCGGNGELVEISVAGDPAKVHKRCLDPFLKADDGIPPLKK